MDQDAPSNVIGRVAGILRSLGQLQAKGGNTSEIARSVGVARPTVHRLLSALREEGLIDRDRSSGRWYLGPELFLLGASAASRYDVTRQARVSVARLAAATGESAFFSARRGDETVCLIREDGSFPIRSFVLHEGVRFPLGVVSAGLVVLALLPDPEIDDYLARVDLVPRYGPAHTAGGIRERIDRTRSEGYALNPGLIVESSWGMAAAVFGAEGRPDWALTLTGVESRFRAERQAELGGLLLREAHVLTRAIARSSPE